VLTRWGFPRRRVPNRKPEAYAEVVTLDGPALDIDLVAASLRADSSDVNAFVESLAAKLEEVVPGRVRVERRRRGLLAPKLVRRIAIDGGDRRLELIARAPGVIETHLGRLSGGIVLKTETPDIDSWLAELGEVLAEEARRSKTTREALERLLIG
jgi:hypothetical protein